MLIDSKYFNIPLPLKTIIIDIKRQLQLETRSRKHKHYFSIHDGSVAQACVVVPEEETRLDKMQ